MAGRDAGLRSPASTPLLLPSPVGAARCWRETRTRSASKSQLREAAGPRPSLLVLPMWTPRTAGRWARCFHSPVCGWDPRGVFLSGRSLSLSLGFGTWSAQG